MAKYDDGRVTALLGSYLYPGEQLYHWAYGTRVPNRFLTVLFLGALGLLLFTKHYVVGLTSHRVLVLRIGGNLQVKEVLEYSRWQLPAARVADRRWTTIELGAFRADFHKRGVPHNREQARAIAAALAPAPQLAAS